MRKLRTLEAEMATLERGISAPEGTPRVRRRVVKRDLRSAVLIYNPESTGNTSRAHSLKTILEKLVAHGIRAKTNTDTSGRSARAFAKAAVQSGESLVIVAGGDGTIEAVSSQLVGSQATLGIIPAGSANNLARSLGVPLDVDEACALIGAGSTRQVDVGHILGEKKAEAKYFLETAGLGLTAIAIPAGQAVRKNRLLGLPQALLKLFDSKSEAVEVILDDGRSISANSQLVTVSNAPLMGRNFLLAPSAKMDDGLLDVAVYDGMGKTELLAHFVAIRDGKRLDDARIAFYQSRSVKIQASIAEPLGEDQAALGDARNVEIEVIPHALTIVVGEGFGLQFPIETLQSIPVPAGPVA
ncbi:MAG TPA: YegS/Rv2252/BmrU family lipid kinase [Candidatus Eremiobacteraceae bacterium]|nr:YegS/Rv2252/BmrU family lipid kinase [Candidatus Eremiobacteraceae bacterium]